MNQDAADSIRLATLYVLSKMETFLVERKAFVAAPSTEGAKRLAYALEALTQISNAATTDVACARMRARAAEPFVLAGDTMPQFLGHNKRTNGHAQALRDMLVSDRRKTA